MSTLTQASVQWSKRSADEKYSSLESLHTAVSNRRQISKEATLPYHMLSVGSDDSGNPVLRGNNGASAQFTNWSFNQLCARVGAPVGYIKRLSPDTRSVCLNEGLRGVDNTLQEIATLRSQGIDPSRTLPLPTADSPNCQLLLSANGNKVVHAFTSERYCRIWDVDITSRLMELTRLHPEWQPAPEAFDKSRGLYASDHDMFAFMVDNDRRIFESLPGGGLGRGFMVANSEVGASTFWVMTFLYNYVCGNHMVWGAQDVREVKIRHIGKTADNRAFSQLAVELTAYSNDSEDKDKARITKAMAYTLGDTKDKVLDRVFGLRSLELTKGRIESAYALAEEKVDWYGSPNSSWGMANGLTQLAKDMPHIDSRVALESAAGKVLALSS